MNLQTGTVLPTQVKDFVLEKAAALDAGEIPSREILPLFATGGLLEFGLPGNQDGKLPELLNALQELAALCFSAAFSVWSHRATMEFLAAANTPFAQEVLTQMRQGQRPGSTAMASGFRALVGLGESGLKATLTPDGYVLNGKIAWASNLYSDAIIVTTAQTEDGRLMLVCFDVGTAGCTVADPLELLALRGTASTSVIVKDLQLPAAQVLAEDCKPLLKKVRPTFSLLQAGICMGLIQSCLEAVPQPLVAPSTVYAEELAVTEKNFQDFRQRLAEVAAGIETADQVGPPVVLQLRLEIGLLVTQAAELELKTAGGAAYLHTSKTNRRYRAAKFVPVQAPTEAQLRWELEQLRG